MSRVRIFEVYDRFSSGYGDFLTTHYPGGYSLSEPVPSRMLMARNHETIVGCCGLSEDIPPDLTLVDLLVHPGFRKHGIGTLLVKAAYERTRDHRFIIPTRSHNVPFYQKAGFRKLLDHEKPRIITNGYVIWMG